jgi:hypothetical protein
VRKGLRSLCGACGCRASLPPSPSRDLFYCGRGETGNRERERSTGDGDGVGKGQGEATGNREGDMVSDGKQRCFSLTQAENADRRSNHAFSLLNPWTVFSGFVHLGLFVDRGGKIRQSGSS